MEAKGEISMRMVHCEDCGKRYDYDVDGFCPRCGAFNQPVWVRSGGTAAAAESPAAQQKRTGRLQRELGENGNRRVPGRAGASAGRSGMDEGVRKESDSISAATETGTDVQSL